MRDRRRRAFGERRVLYVQMAIATHEDTRVW